LREFAPFLRSPTVAGDRLLRHVSHDRDLTYSWLYRLAFARQSDHADALPLPFDLEELDARLLRFAGRPRVDQMLALLGEE
jgi:hypothetical protein